MENTSINKLLLKMAPPVMLTLLIQAIYNIIDSYYVSKYSAAGLTALSIIYPIQLLMTALSTGTGAGLNILISRMDGSKDDIQQESYYFNGIILGIVNYLLFVIIGIFFIKPFFYVSSDNIDVITNGISYASIILFYSFGLFIEAICTKIYQAKGNMFYPMIAQVSGALCNVILDPILIFGYLGFPRLEIAGAAIATVIGQVLAMFIVLIPLLYKKKIQGKISLSICIEIYKTGLPSILMQSLYTVYIIGLNMILKIFSEDAVTVLGIYYKLQTFFYIPLFGLQQVILPIISYHYGAQNTKYIKQVMKYSLTISFVVMTISTLVFLFIPDYLLQIFTTKQTIINIGMIAFRIICLSFIPAGIKIIYSVYYQGINQGHYSIVLTLLREVLLLVPLAWVFHYFGLIYVWMTFPLSEFIVVSSIWFINKKILV